MLPGNQRGLSDAAAAETERVALLLLNEAMEEDEEEIARRARPVKKEVFPTLLKRKKQRVCVKIRFGTETKTKSRNSIGF